MNIMTGSSSMTCIISITFKLNEYENVLSAGDLLFSSVFHCLREQRV